MRKRSKRYKAAAEKIDAEKKYNVSDALGLLKQMGTTKFDQSVEIALKLSIDPKRSEQAIRGSLIRKGTG